MTIIHPGHGDGCDASPVSSCNKSGIEHFGAAPLFPAGRIPPRWITLTMKKIGFLSFGHWTPSPGSATRSAADALRQSIDLAVAAEELGADGAYVRVHHFARQLASPFPLLAAMAARTSRIELGTAVIDMRYENPLYMAEEAAATDLLSEGRLQLGVDYCAHVIEGVLKHVAPALGWR